MNEKNQQKKIFLSVVESGDDGTEKNKNRFDDVKGKLYMCLFGNNKAH